jgi:hypothetical protein
VASGHAIFQSKSQKPHEREAFADQAFDVFICEIVKRLQHQDLEHQHGVEGPAAGIALPFLGRKPDDRFDLSAETLERNDDVKRLERIALGANRLETLVEIVEAQLPHGIPRPPNHLATPNLICLGRASAIFRGALLISK